MCQGIFWCVKESFEQFLLGMKKVMLQWSGRLSQSMEEFLAFRGREGWKASLCVCPSFLFTSVADVS